MTVQQEAYALIDSMPDEGVEYVINLIHNLKPSLIEKNDYDSVDVSKRIGIGKGIIYDHEDFDKWNDEIADLFEGLDL